MKKIVLTCALALAFALSIPQVTYANMAAPKDAVFTVESYALNYSTEIETEDGQYAVLTDEGIAGHNEEQTVDAITFKLDFAPKEEYDVVVSYAYHLGGYPDHDFNAKVGRIEYYLTPASMWNDFGASRLI